MQATKSASGSGEIEIITGDYAAFADEKRKEFGHRWNTDETQIRIDRCFLQDLRKSYVKGFDFAHHDVCGSSR
jgi:hypothetical protein